MAVTIEDIKKLRHLTSAGLSDCKAALTETNGDMDAAVEILRQKGKAIAAKREDRQASEGCVLADVKDNFAAIVALNCETDFVAKNATFVELTKKLLALALDNKVKSIDELKALTIDGRTVAELVVEESGKTGEKTEISAYEYLEGASVTSYNHFGNKLSTIVSFNLEGVDVTLDTVKDILGVDKELWLEECKGIREYYAQFGDKLPKKLAQELDDLEARLKK